ncbi:MAG: phosphoglycerate dehydrogenase [Nitrososphaeria archaeon]
MSRPCIAITSKSYGVHCKKAVELLEEFAAVDRKNVSSEDEMRSIAMDYDGVIVGNEKMDRDILISSDKLRIIARHGVGVDNIDLDAATQKGIIVTYTPQSNSDSVAEYAIMLMLGIAKNFPKASYEISNGKWVRLLGSELLCKTVGIVGFGAVGRRVAKKLSGFDVKILAYDPFVKGNEIEKEGALPVGLDELLRTSDFVTIHVALSAETHHLINRDRLRLMKKSAFLINTSRGSIIDESALYDSLKNGEISGAALDVFEQEPITKDNPLLMLDNVVLSPHMANFTSEALIRMDMMNAEDLKRFFQGKKPLFVANPIMFNGK